MSVHEQESNDYFLQQIQKLFQTCSWFITSKNEMIDYSRQWLATNRKSLLNVKLPILFSKGCLFNCPPPLNTSFLFVYCECMFLLKLFAKLLRNTCTVIARKHFYVVHRHFLYSFKSFWKDCKDQRTEGGCPAALTW